MTRISRYLATALLLFWTACVAAHAGSPLGEIEYRYPCQAGSSGRTLEIEYGGFAEAAVSLQFWGGDPVLSVNEDLAFEQPAVTVAFDYLVACEMAKRMQEDDLDRAVRDKAFAQRVFHTTDCAALTLLNRLGVARRYDDIASLLDYFSYRKGDAGYLGVPYWQRVEAMQRNCPP
ncbi:MAG: hypothetical protein AAGF79_12130 [Pseudomonadota bacterium]